MLVIVCNLKLELQFDAKENAKILRKLFAFGLVVRAVGGEASRQASTELGVDTPSVPSFPLLGLPFPMRNSTSIQCLVSSITVVVLPYN